MSDPATAAWQAAAHVAGAAISAWSQHSANKANARQAALNRQFQDHESSTAYQRSMADMRKAGLNPILAYAHPASTPGGAQAHYASVAPNMSSVASNAVQGYNQTRSTNIAKQIASANLNLINKQTDLASSNAQLAQNNAELVATKLPSARKQAQLATSGFGRHAVEALKYYRSVL
ncbi:MAG: DNA pilot protein [Microviridae sp.]|nr:MAG: DNA pilot protein [Microviridae sp.]